ncbi:MAG: hypothetical protein JW841_01240, partial [Deltaproteobacteria bacterium]|nr:hypothetical protein [Deltaproteobacteria bacterium]
MNNGCMLPATHGCWKEAKLAVMVRNDEATPSRYIAHFGDQDGFRQKLEDAIIAERGMNYEEMVWVADGARGNWNLCGDLTIKVTEVLDWIHAVENGMKCGRVLLGDSSSYLELWKKRIEELLHRGDVNLLIRELMDCIEFASDEQLEAINQIVGYYRYND